MRCAKLMWPNIDVLENLCALKPMRPKTDMVRPEIDAS